jgi:hypothetical protein
MKIKLIFFNLIALSFMTACLSKNTVTKLQKVDSSTITNNMHTLISYKDGNNNLWEIDSETIRYKAVSNSQSSSGLYKGGKDRDFKINKEQYSSLQNLAKAALADSTAHLDKRLMGSVLLVFEDNNLIIAMNSKVQKELEAFFKLLK